jgi:hypothetical protein
MERSSDHTLKKGDKTKSKRFELLTHFQMTSYDSDSSLDDQNEYTETSVLLGYASKEATEDAISHLGGVPVSTAHPLLPTHLC